MKSRKKEQGGDKRPEDQGIEVKAVTSRKRKGKEVGKQRWGEEKTSQTVTISQNSVTHWKGERGKRSKGKKSRKRSRSNNQGEEEGEKTGKSVKSQSMQWKAGGGDGRGKNVKDDKKARKHLQVLKSRERAGIKA